MFPARVALCFPLMSGAAVAQQYVISTVAGGAPPPTPVTGTSASIGSPQGIAVDGAESVHVGERRVAYSPGTGTASASVSPRDGA